MDVDRSIIRRLEASEATTTVQVVEAMRSQVPHSPAESLPTLGGALVAMGPGRFVNRGVGVTLDDLSPTDVDAIEDFFASRSLPPAVQLSSWSPAVTIDVLMARGFRLGWFRAMFAMEPAHSAARASADVVIGRVDRGDIDVLLDTYARGFGFADPAARTVSDEFARASVAVDDHHTFLATIDGQIAGCGSVHVADGVGWVGGAATLPEFRRRGVQASLVAHRVGVAADLGCDLIAATAVPSGDSARNLLRLGFQLVQTQSVVTI